MKLKKILFLLIILLLPLSVNAKEVDITLFYGDGCPHCAHEEKYLEVLEKQLGKNIHIIKSVLFGKEFANKLYTEMII